MLVTVTLPTNDRRAMLPDVIDCYLSQDWKEKELLVIDDGTDCCRDLFNRVPAEELRYFYLESPVKNLSVKRNLATRFANGEVIIHFDSDDWSASTRITHQVEHLLKSGVEVGGYHSAMFYDMIDQKASIYRGSPNYAWGPTFCYRRDFALRNPWPEDVNLAEDGMFLAKAKKTIKSQDGYGRMVVKLHSGNTRRSFDHIPIEALPAEFLKTLAGHEAIR